jgi:hypothetical protein
MKENPFLVTHKIAGTINNSFQEFVVLRVLRIISQLREEDLTHGVEAVSLTQ